MSRAPTHRSLAGVVTSFWVSDRDDADRDEIVLPRGRSQLVVDGEIGSVVLVGPQTRPSTVRSSKFAVGMSLSGVGLHALTDTPVQELVDDVVDPDAIWAGGRWSRCVDRADPAEILACLEHEALRHLRVEADRNRQVAIAERAICGGTRLDAVASTIGADRRRLVPAFREAVGLAPKHYQRIRRFQQAVKTLRTTSPVPQMAAVASMCGYADQAHMSREFKEFSGLTPRQVHGDTSTAYNHVPINAHERE